eukprot:1005504-Amphidinium_carterae.1
MQRWRGSRVALVRHCGRILPSASQAMRTTVRHCPLNSSWPTSLLRVPTVAPGQSQRPPGLGTSLSTVE